MMESGAKGDLFVSVSNLILVISAIDSGRWAWGMADPEEWMEGRVRWWSFERGPGCVPQMRTCCWIVH